MNMGKPPHQQQEHLESQKQSPAIKNDETSKHDELVAQKRTDKNNSAPS